MKKITLISTFLLLSSPLAHAQWEKLPLYSGHADYLVQNKYKPNEVFAVINSGGIYGSKDYGDTWKAIVDDKEELGWGTDITSFEVAMNGDYLVYADNSL